MQNESWMHPALQENEAVLLPALERRNGNFPRFGARYLPPPSTVDSFRPVSQTWDIEPQPAPEGCTRPRGSMAGRSVLRAAGVYTEPFYRTRPYCRNRPIFF